MNASWDSCKGGERKAIYWLGKEELDHAGLPWIILKSQSNRTINKTDFLYFLSTSRTITPVLVILRSFVWLTIYFNFFNCNCFSFMIPVIWNFKWYCSNAPILQPLSWFYSVSPGILLSRSFKTCSKISNIVLVNWLHPGNIGSSPGPLQAISFYVGKCFLPLSEKAHSFIMPQYNPSLIKPTYGFKVVNNCRIWKNIINDLYIWIYFILVSMIISLSLLLCFLLGKEFTLSYIFYRERDTHICLHFSFWLICLTFF